jgi:hypothetical protein
MAFNSQMDLALIEARQAAEAGEVPVGAVLVMRAVKSWLVLATERGAIATRRPMRKFWSSGPRRRLWGKSVWPDIRSMSPLNPALCAPGLWPMRE